MTNTIMGSVLLLLILLSQESLAQVKRFCDNDSRSEVVKFCKDLDDFQNAVNADKTATADTLSGFLNKLDFSHAAATDKFITATGAILLENAVITKAASLLAQSDAGQARPDRQLGAPGNSSGTTSLISKPGSAEILSLALDTGALTQSVNGTTATLSSNADQIFRLVTGTDPDCTVTCQSLGWFEDRVLNPLNISASLDLAQQKQSVVPTSGQASGNTPVTVSSAAIPTGVGKLSGISARYQLRNNFDPRSAEFRKKWKNAVMSSATLKNATITLQDATDEVMKSLTPSASALDRTKALEAARSDPTGKALANFFDQYFSNAAQAVDRDAKLRADILAVMPLRAAYRDAWFKALDDTVGSLFTFEYSYGRPVNQPESHDFKLIFAYNFQAMGMLTFNGSVSAYGGTIPAGARYGRLHYGQASTEYDRTLSGKESSIQTQLSLAGYWQYQPHPSVLNISAGTVVPGTNIPLPNGTQEFIGTAGSLWVTQAKLTIKAAGGINVPIAVSWSNKTDLLQGSNVGAQVGISYNFSSLAGLFTGGH